MSYQDRETSVRAIPNFSNYYASTPSTGKYAAAVQNLTSMAEIGPDLPSERDLYQSVRKRKGLQCYIYSADLNMPEDPMLHQFIQACYSEDNQKALDLLGVQDTSDESLLLGLKLAIRDGNLSLVEELLKRGVKMNDSVLKEVQTVPMAKLLVKHGLNVYTISSSGALFYAILNENSSLVAWLITHGFKVRRDEIHMLAQHSTPEIFALLLQFQEVDLESTEALHVAARIYDSFEERLPMLRYLLGLGLDPNARAEHNLRERLELPLGYADRGGLTPAVKCLLEAGADPFLKNRFGMSPYDRAVRSGYQELAVEYLKYGAPHPKEETKEEIPALYPVEYQWIRRHDNFIKELRSI